MLFYSQLRPILTASCAFLACCHHEYLLSALLGLLFVSMQAPRLVQLARRRRQPALSSDTGAAGLLPGPVHGPIARVNEPAAPTEPSAEGLDLAVLSHELKAPLVGVLGLARILSDTDLNSAQRGLAKGIVRSSENLTGLLESLLDSAAHGSKEAGAAAGTHGDVRTTREPVHLVGLRDDLMGPFEAAHRNPALKLRAELFLGGHQYLAGDPVRLGQIGRNFLSNALKFTERGEIVLRMMVVGDPAAPSLRISVSDTGMGIPRHRQAAIFERFEQADSGIQARFGGSGLGLAIVKELAEAMDGEVTLESSEGTGTTITAEIPMGIVPKPVPDGPEQLWRRDLQCRPRPVPV